MRKRKSPVVLVTILVIMLVAVGIIYAPGRGDGHDHAAEVAQAPPPAAEKGDRPKVSSSDVASMASSSMQAAKPGRMSPMDGPTASGPSIAVPKPTSMKPVPNDTSTTSQWYTGQTKK